MNTSIGPGKIERSPRRRRAFTIVEIITVCILVGLALTILYEIYFGLMARTLGVQKRAKGQMAVRILLVRLRHELKRATGIVQIEKANQLLRIPLEDRTRKQDDRERNYWREYEFLPDKKDIMVRKLNREFTPVEERLWLGGNSQIMMFKCYDTGENERILYQYYRVIIEIEHYEVKMKDILTSQGGPISEEERKKSTVHLTTTIYPRRVNMELRIEVPQEGGSGI